jgi:predicted RNase H-like nuclease (RuvC/YqgF family)
MNIENLEKRIEALEALIASSKLTDKYDGEVIIKGLDVTLDQLIQRGDAQTKLIKLNNAIVDKIDELEKRIKASEENIHQLERDIDKHLG